MRLLTRLTLNAYYQVTRPLRAVRNAAEARQGRAPVCVVFYHRVADTVPNTWTISNPLFERQIAWMKQRFDMVSLAEAQARIARGFNDRPAVAITFDDGYAENCARALPFLVREKVPVTYFVATGHVLTGNPFPHDVAAGMPLRPNSPAEILALAEAGIEIGAHTRTHADLGKVTCPRQLHDEVITATDELSTLLGRPIRYFAFPYGMPENLSQEAVALVRQAGFAGACSAYGDYNWPGDPPFHIKRIHGDPDMLCLANWLSVEPRKSSIGRSRTKRVAPLFAHAEAGSGAPSISL